MPRHCSIKASLIAVTMLTPSAVAALGAALGMPLKAPAPPFTWTGCYAGAVAGGGFGQKDLTNSAGILAALPGTTSSRNVSGYLVGGGGGCDYQFAPSWVLGIEGVATGGRISDKTNFA